MPRFRFYPCLLVLALSVLSFARVASAERLRLDFNRDWRLLVGDPQGAAQPGFDDRAWKPVTTPHAWNEDSAYRVSIHDLPTGIAWYRKHFTLPALAPGQHVVVEFEGVRQAAEIYLNGVWIARHEDGVSAFGVDLTDHLRPGENILALRTDNRWDYREKATGTPFQWNNINFYANYGGINHRVWLHILPAVHQTLPLYSSLGTTGVDLWASDFDLVHHSARIHAESQLRNNSAVPHRVGYRVALRDAEGHEVARFDAPQTTLVAPGALATVSASALVPDLHFWSWGYGYLYTVTTTLLVDGRPADALSTRTGFRQTAFHDGMIELNGRVLQVHGYAARATNEWPALGTDVPAWVSDFSNGLIVSGNGNLIRWMHVTPTRQDVESCDRVGLPEAMPAGDAEGDPSGRHWGQRLELMRDSIIYNRNNPSILFYESGNKGIGDEHMQAMRALRDRFDPHGGRAIGAREMLASSTAEYGGEMLYINKSATKPLWAHEYNRDEAARKFWNAQTPPFHADAPLYNRNQDSFTLEDVLRWDDYFRARPGTGRRVSAGGVNIGWFDENSHFRGDNNYRRSGEVDAMRIPKDAYFAHQVLWDGWVDPEHPRLHITGHWNYAPGALRTIFVVANTASVELKLNGRSLGIAQPQHDFLFTFARVPYAPGTLEAIGYDAGHRAVAQTQLASTGEPARIRLMPHLSPTGLHADGADLALVDVELVDAAGRRVPTAMQRVRFSLDGPAEWRGGIAQGSAHPVAANTAPTDTHGLAATPVAPLLHDDNFILSRELPVEAGINRIALRATTTPGRIHLRAEVDGLSPAELVLDAHAALADEAPLPLHLDRGPTPSTPSYRVTRNELAIASATAGANAADAAKAYDDDETSAWTNASATSTDLSSDGLPLRHAEPDTRPIAASLDTAWIEFTLARAAQPTAIDLKLVSFRLRRYPLRISLDGETVYEGTTPTSLGYITLPLAARHAGTHLRIALTAPPLDVAETHALVEVDGHIDQAQPEGKRAKPILGILEADIYEPAPEK